MALFRKFFYRKPPDGLLEISERVYVFDSCFTTDVLEDDKYKVHMGGIVSQLRDHFPDSSFMVFNFREGEHQSFLTEVLSEYDMTVMDYPRHYEGCPLLTMEMIHHFLRSTESWLSLSKQNILLMHCERGGWPVLAFMTAGLLIYRKQFTGEQKTLDMIYKQAPRELLQLLSPLNPMPSQMRYLQYISRRNVSSIWPPLDRALTLDCVILRFIPNFDGEGGCRPLFRIYGQDPFISSDQTPKVLFSTPKRSKSVQLYRQADCELVKIDIHCHIQGDVVLECISLDDDLKREAMMFRVMFNTAFIRSNILMLNRDEIDILWNAKDRFLKNFRAEVLFSEMDASNSVISVELPHTEDKDGLPIEAFAKAQEIFSNLAWIDSKEDAALHDLQQLAESNVFKEKQDTVSPQKATTMFMPQKAIPDLPKDKLLINEAYDVRIKSSSTITQKSDSPLKHFSDTSATSQNALLQNVVVVHHQTQPKNISKFLQSSQSSPVLSGNSLQSSLVHVSRYHSVPSSMGNLGITALLHDHDSFGRSEAVHSITLSPSTPALLPSANSAMLEPAETRTALPAATLSALRSPKQLQVPSLSATAHASVTTSFPLSPSATLASLESPLRNDPKTSTSQKSVAALTIKASSMSQSTSTQRPSSLLLQSKSQSMPPPPPPPPIPPPPPPPPLISSSTKPSFTSLVLQKTLVDTEIAASHPSISINSFPLKGIASSPVKYNAPSSNKTITSSPVNNNASSLVKGPSTSTPPPPPPLPHSGGMPYFALSPSAKTCARPPHAPLPTVSIKYKTSVVPPPPPTPPSTISKKDMLLTTPPPSLPTPSKISIKEQPAVPLPRASFSYSPSGSYSHSTVVNNSYASPPSPLPSCSVPMPSTSGLAPCHPSQNSSVLNFQPEPPPPGPSKGLRPSSGPPPPPSGLISLPGGIKGQNLARTMSNSNRCLQSSSKKASLKPLHWVKVTRAMQGSLWAETQKFDEASEAPEFDMSELESLFSTAVPNLERGSGDKPSGRSALGQKSDRVQLIDLRRANNCEIMLTKVKISLTDLLSSVLALDDSVFDIDQIDNLIKFCPTKEEMELLKNFNGIRENLGKCEQYFWELMKVPRVESKLRVFSFKVQFRSQVDELSLNLKIVNNASQEIRSSVKLKRIMQTILSLGNALNQGTARGSAIGFRLDSLLKLTETRARNNKMTLMHYLCKVLAEKLPELLSFPKDLINLEISSKIQLKALAEEMQAISKGLEKVEQELTASENDGPVSETFRKNLKEFLVRAEAEVRMLTSLYSNVGRSADALSLYFGEDPVRCQFEQVISTLLNFVRMFIRAHEENCKQLELEKKKLQKTAENEKVKQNDKMKPSSAKKEGDLTHSPLKNARDR